jgi:hypothetical protein
MSELIYRSDDEDDTIPEAQSYGSDVVCEDDNGYNNEKDDIVIYNDMLLIIMPMNRSSIYNRCDSFWAVDYYQYRTYKIRDNTDDPITIGTKFCIEHSAKVMRFTGGFDETDLAKKKLYTHYIENVVKIEDKSEENLHKLHCDLLRKRVLRKLLNTPSKDEIIERELQHRNIIHREIEKKITGIPALLYACAEEGCTNVSIKFHQVIENIIINRGALPRFEKCPCADGKVREKFMDYVYYLFEELYHKHLDEGDDPHLWIGARIIEQLREIYPHLNISCVSTSGYIVPCIVFSLNIDTSVNILTQ